VRNLQSIEATTAAAWEAFGRIDILVNNAGCNVRKPALDVTWDDWNLILDTNLRGSFFVAQQVAKRMVPNGYGRIINIGSVTSVFGYAGLGPYGASRGSIRQLTMSLADDWVNTESPSTVLLQDGFRRRRTR
jgi:NAD(P)-dependent dehydrogenase (short-subunit alcohol dehydrogenase family)